MAILCSTGVRSKAPLEQALSDIAAAGFSLLDLLAFEGWAHIAPSTLADCFDQTCAHVQGLLARHNLRVGALNSGLGIPSFDRSPTAQDRRRRETEALLRLAKHLGAAVVAVQAGRPDPDIEWETLFRASTATLRELAEMGRQHGVTVALEMHVHALFETPELGRRLLEALPELALAYDPSHFVMQGIPIRETAWLLDHAAHVHLRDAAPGRMMVPFGEGQVDFDWLLGALKERGYTGHVAIEYLETDEFDALDSALRLREALERRLS